MPSRWKLLLLLLLGAGALDESAERHEAAKKKAEAAREHAKKAAEEKQKTNQERLESQKMKQEASARMSKEVAGVDKLCKEQKDEAMQSWRDIYSEINDKIDHEFKKQQVLTSPQTAAVLRNLFRPPLLKGAGFIRAGVMPNELKQQLNGYLTKHRSRSFSEAFDPLLGNQRKTKFLPLPPSWIKKAGFIDNILRPMLEKLSGQKMELVHIHPGIRIYGQGSSLMHHLDSPTTPLTAALLLSATEEGESWHFELGMGDKPKPMPLTPGQMLVYEGARMPHGRSGQLKGGEVALVFAYYQPSTYDADRIQKRLDQVLAHQKVPPRGRPPGAPKMPQRPRDQFGNAEEL